ncbi:tyrosine-type recombinase/integrase [Salibacterium lacus]|uniref:Tyrosine-type recombinase/integrase n=1 Tax=Salibacterium lacus TaxID=1898109 RepID=A0ABW5SW80_9BACI
MLVRFAIDELYTEKKFENVTENTMVSYKAVLEPFHAFLEEKGIENIEYVTKRHIKEYLLHRQEKGNNATTVNNHHKYVNAFFRWLTEEKIVHENPVTGIKKQKEDIQIHVFTDEEVQQIISYFRRMNRREKTFYSIRDYNLFLTLISTGLRLSEAINLRWTDVNYDNGSLVVSKPKSRKQETVPLTERLMKELSLYQKHCEKKFHTSMDYIFVTSRNKPLTRNAVKCIFKRVASAMNFPNTRVSAHTCRHYYAKKFIENGGDISQLQKMLRHTNIATTQKYLHFFGNEVAEANEKYNALNNLDI